MSANNGTTRLFAKIGLLLMTGVVMSACAVGIEKWKEEVQLSDGRVIVVERETLRESGGDEWAFNRSGTKPKEYRIRFEHPDSAGLMIEWRSIKTDHHSWPELPLVLDVVSKQPIVFSDVANAGGCHVYSKYIYRSGAWIEEPLPQRFEQRATNLLVLSNKEMLSLIDLETKRKKNSDARAQDFKQVGPTHPYCR